MFVAQTRQQVLPGDQGPLGWAQRHEGTHPQTLGGHAACKGACTGTVTPMSVLQLTPPRTWITSLSALPNLALSARSMPMDMVALDEGQLLHAPCARGGQGARCGGVGHGSQHGATGLPVVAPTWFLPQHLRQRGS